MIYPNFIDAISFGRKFAILTRVNEDDRVELVKIDRKGNTVKSIEVSDLPLPQGLTNTLINTNDGKFIFSGIEGGAKFSRVYNGKLEPLTDMNDFVGFGQHQVLFPDVLAALGSGGDPEDFDVFLVSINDGYWRPLEVDFGSNYSLLLEPLNEEHAAAIVETKKGYDHFLISRDPETAIKIGSSKRPEYEKFLQFPDTLGPVAVSETEYALVHTVTKSGQDVPRDPDVGLDVGSKHYEDLLIEVFNSDGELLRTKEIAYDFEAHFGGIKNLPGGGFVVWYNKTTSYPIVSSGPHPRIIVGSENEASFFLEQYDADLNLLDQREFDTTSDNFKTLLDVNSSGLTLIGPPFYNKYGEDLQLSFVRFDGDQNKFTALADNVNFKAYPL